MRPIDPSTRVSFRENVDVCEDDEIQRTRSRLASTESIKSSGGSQKYANLRESLTREQLNRDPMYFYEVVKVLGEGSMGSVKLVRKRSDKIGGSARREIQEAVKRQKQNQKCLDIPIVGGIFGFCIDAKLKDSDRTSSRTFSRLFSSIDDIGTSTGTNDPSINGSVRSYDSPHASDIIYAMKSIVLTHLTKKEYVDELRNEISILKQLDHPHIVRYVPIALCACIDCGSRLSCTCDKLTFFSLAGPLKPLNLTRKLSLSWKYAVVVICTPGILTPKRKRLASSVPF